MNAESPSPSTISDAADPKQKQRLILGVVVWISGWTLGLALIPVVNGLGLADGLEATLDSILLLGFPKLFLIIAVSIMGKSGFAYLKSLLGAHFRRLAPAATVSPLRYKIGLILFLTLIVLGSIGPYVTPDAFPVLQQNRRVIAMTGDVLLLVSLFLLGGDFWDKLRALFVREAKVVFPAKGETA